MLEQPLTREGKEFILQNSSIGAAFVMFYAQTPRQY